MDLAVQSRTARGARAGSLTAAFIAMAVLAGCLPATSSPSVTPPPATAPPQRTPVPTPTEAPASTPGGGLAVTLEPFVRIDGAPLAIAWPPDGSDRLFVAAQDGRIWVVDDGEVLADPLLDLRSLTNGGGEQGLLGLAVHPSFPDDPRVFVNYTDKAGDTVVASYEIDPDDPNRADPATAIRIIGIDQPYANHNGGALAFGPDGHLYVSLGDGGSGGDPLDSGQRLDTLLGKILRLDIDPSTARLPYTTPADNPFADGGGLPEIWHYGLRNPWRMSFDRATGDLWIGDVGQGAFEEVDRAPSGQGGLNFGWNRTEGNHCFRSEDCDLAAFVAPAAEYGRDLGCTVIGGYVYRGTAFPELAGMYLFADYCEGRIMAIDPAAGGVAAPTTVGIGSSGVSAFGEDAAGELYVTNLNGQVSRVVAAPR